ncbi:endochitinase [Encephalitozoon intestinalis ATCC 50506]|uniref:Endochitinase n=1 Tax=Encephalitozoon intestinalis (strain ATCC 50506) TaxID=876142 RepID=E0S902_ENCIT|nr:endochitinase [Encephalitozoon intestinalis ATCC 50506]ADM12267.1 endochitinase [Encephalitozoon intestinalis ATCC 50506]UTX46074.1 endochitinase [Encephalitozoon intestinalis]
MLVFFLGLTFAKDACVSGSAECVANTLRVCGIKNQWIYVDCPSGTECAVKGSEISCVPNGGKGELESHDKKKPKKRDESEASQSLEEKQDSGDDLGESPEDNRQSEDDKPEEPNEEQKKKVHGKKGDEDQEGKKKTKKEKDSDEKTKDKHLGLGEDKKKNTKGNKKKEPKVVTKTVSVLKKETTTTVTVLKTVVQKQQPTEIKLEYTSSDIESKVKPVGSSSPGQGQALQGSSRNVSKAGHPTSLPGIESMGGASSPGKAGQGATPAAPSSSGSPSSGKGTSVGSSSSSAPSSPTSNKSSSAPSSQGSTPESQGKAQTAGGGTGGATPSTGSQGGKGAESGKSSGGSAGKTTGGTSSSAGSQEKKETGGSAGGSTQASGGSQGQKESEGSKQPEGGAGGTSPSTESQGGKKTESGKSSSSEGKGGSLLSADKLTKVMTNLGYSPNSEYIDAVVLGVNERFSDLNQAVMFVAQCAHESGGYQYIEEIACAGGTGCAGQYGTGAPGKSYHGRGFIQLSWPENYKAAGEALGRGDELYNNPEKVVENPSLAVDVSIFYWESRVADAPGVKENHFGATTKAINGALECTGSNIDKSKKRYEIYTALVEEFGVSNPADESGCYS